MSSPFLLKTLPQFEVAEELQKAWFGCICAETKKKEVWDCTFMHFHD